ncbi:4-hydroxybutyrate--CoA ligase (ADP-forming) [Desulfovibrionales bacterium]
MDNNIYHILNPKTIAVVGATNRVGSVGLAVFNNLIRGGFQGIIFPVNFKARSIQSVKAYPNLLEVPDPIDLVIIVAPPETVIETVDQAAQVNAKGVVVITAGFKEIGSQQGAELEKQLTASVRKAGIALIGPNCLGIMNTNPKISMNASFAQRSPKPGNIAFLSQSGALCTSVLDVAASRNIGFSKFISFGNKADITEIDLLRYLKDDPDTKVILMYLEDISDGRRFIEIAREIAWESRKPILAMKSGVSAEGAKAASSHTGSMAGSDAAYDAIFLQSGIQRVESVNELFHYAQAFSCQPLPKGNRIAIITNAGGPGIIATDAAIRCGLKLASLSEHTKDNLRKNLPPIANIYNPVDIIGDANCQRYEIALSDLIADEGVDGVVVILSPQAMTDVLETAQIIPRVIKGLSKPILCSFMGIVDVRAGVDYLQEQGIPNYIFPEAAIRSMAAMVRFSERLSPRPRWYRPVKTDCATARNLIVKALEKTNNYYMLENEAMQLLACYGFPLLKSRLVTDHDQIVAAAKYVGFPLVMKIVSPQIVHKSEAGGVKVDVKNLDEAYEAYAEIIVNARRFNPTAKITGVNLMQMAGRGIEIILGANRDHCFGPIIMFGLGGILVEALHDVTFRLAPMWESSAENMINSIRTVSILKGVRGNPPSDIAAIKDCILRLSQMLEENPEIVELDINPLIAYSEGQGCAVADCRILVKRQV